MPTQPSNFAVDYPANPFIRAAAPAPAGGSSGWWTPPTGADIKSLRRTGTGEAFLQKNMSPQWIGARENVYNSYQQQPQSLADLWQGYMQGNPELEQMDYNQALARIKGQAATAQQGLMAGLPPGGMDSGAFAGGLADIQRQFGQGVGELGIQQYMKALQDRETRQRAMIDYANQDIANRMGWQQGYGGWVNQMFPVEQWAQMYPRQLAQQAASAQFNRALAIEQQNMARRNEAMGWLDKAMDWRGQGARDYYGGQGQWLNYGGQRGSAIAGGYGGGWSPW